MWVTERPEAKRQEDCSPQGPETVRFLFSLQRFFFVFVFLFPAASHFFVRPPLFCLSLRFVAFVSFFFFWSFLEWINLFFSLFQQAKLKNVYSKKKAFAPGRMLAVMNGLHLHLYEQLLGLIPYNEISSE